MQQDEWANGHHPLIPVFRLLLMAVTQVRCRKQIQCLQAKQTQPQASCSHKAATLNDMALCTLDLKRPATSNNTRTTVHTRTWPKRPSMPLNPKPCGMNSADPLASAPASAGAGMPCDDPRAVTGVLEAGGEKLKGGSCRGGRLALVPCG